MFYSLQAIYLFRNVVRVDYPDRTETKAQVPNSDDLDTVLYSSQLILVTKKLQLMDLLDQMKSRLDHIRVQELSKYFCR